MEQPGIQTTIDVALTRTERAAAALARALLLNGQAELVQLASAELHQSCVALSGSMPGLRGGDPVGWQLRQRLVALGQGNAMQREALLRRAAVVERSLQSIVPATRQSTYGAGAAAYSRSTKQSGAFKLLAA